MSEVKELAQYLATSTPKHLKIAACKIVLKLAGSSDGLTLILKEKILLSSIFTLINDEDADVCKISLTILINISADPLGCQTLLYLDFVDTVEVLLKCVEDANFHHSDVACAILSNFTRLQTTCEVVFNRIANSLISLDRLIAIFCQLDYNKKGNKHHILAPVIANISQLSDGRRYILDKHILQCLLPFTEYSASKQRRYFVIAVLHNCCFEKEKHEWLLSEDVDIASHLLLPLCGPDVYTEEENDSFPLDLQYLPSNKEREGSSEIRKLLIEALMMLCSTQKCREILRSKNMYLILRELHKWEKDKTCLLLIEDLVNIMLRTEEEIGVDDLNTVEVSKDMSEKFFIIEKEFIDDCL